MKRYGFWQTILAVTAVCLALSSCGGAMEETAEEMVPAEEPVDIVPDIGLEEPAAEAPPEMGDAVGEPDVPTIEAAQPTPTPDFGSVAYEVPQRMVRNEPVQVILLVSPSEDADLVDALEEELADAGQEPGNVTTATVEVAKSMRAQLVASPEEAFDIQRLQNPTQPLSETEPTQWEWAVVPRIGGTHRLILVIDRIVDYDGGEQEVKEEVLRDAVTVEVPIALRLQDAMGSFDIKWLAGVLIFPFFFYWLNRRDSRKETND